ncbi:MAG: aminotransferase class III-fold pyridoxal phosphate-dependent enzyme [Clostridium sp.]|nr:aminotransferase class III-fold pyridoxal phosphate-dependent enzyme [Clostridium sp.]
MLTSLEEQFHGEDLAAFIIEPVVGSGGIIPIPTLYLQRLEELCKENDVLLICDEVATGFGRTGKMFCYQHAGIKPDIVCMAKGINSGYLPMGAVSINEKVHDVFHEADVPLFHLSTQNGNPICCSAAIETIRQLTEQDEKLIKHVCSMGELLATRLWEELNDHPYVADVRGQGFMLAIDMVESKVTDEQFTQEHLFLLVEKLKKMGILVESCYNEGVTSTISLFFSFIITEEEMQTVIRKITKGLYNFI